MKINVYNETNINVWKYIRLIKRIFRTINLKKKFNLIFVDEETIQELNKNYRNIDKITDVISFANIDDTNNTDVKSLGEIFICINKAKEQAKEYGHSLAREMAFLSIHGYLHLCGFDHQTKEEEKIMFGIQDEILNNVGVKR